MSHLKRPSAQVDDVYMVFEYLEYDLWALANSCDINLTPTHIRTYMRQLLEAIAYMHKHKVSHDQMNPQNIAPPLCMFSCRLRSEAGIVIKSLRTRQWWQIHLLQSAQGLPDVLGEAQGQGICWSGLITKSEPFHPLLTCAGYASRPQVREPVDRGRRPAKGILSVVSLKLEIC